MATHVYSSAKNPLEVNEGESQQWEASFRHGIDAVRYAQREIQSYRGLYFIVQDDTDPYVRVYHHDYGDKPFKIKELD